MVGPQNFPQDLIGKWIYRWVQLRAGSVSGGAEQKTASTKCTLARSGDLKHSSNIFIFVVQEVLNNGTLALKAVSVKHRSSNQVLANYFLKIRRIQQRHTNKYKNKHQVKILFCDQINGLHSNDIVPIFQVFKSPYFYLDINVFGNRCQ